jgi:asparagine synthase (glutamine-hydrolysing)
VCGIAGKVDFAGAVSPSVIENMCAAITHRGPDSRGTWCSDCVALGMQRLAIIDVSGGDQPIFNEDGSVAVVLNGEIYNFPALRSDLTKRGHTFSTRCDTEVLAHLYEEYGERLVERVRGMFAFAIWDARRRHLLLARDRVGKKPLFVARRGSKVWFASEMMAMLQDPEIVRVPDPRAIASYLALQYVPHPLSAFAGVQKLPPASTLVVTADGVSERRYWALDYGDAGPPASKEELAERLRELIWDATRIRLMSEVPLGAFLSGGIDSSAVVAAMADQSSGPVKTFSIGFPDADFDELRFARRIARRFSTDHHELVVEPHAIEIMPKLARHYGEPFADASAIPSFYLAEMTSRHVTVALNGDGGDESFAGYRRYISSEILGQLGRLPGGVRRLAPVMVRRLGTGSRSNSTRARINRLARVLAVEPDARYALWMSAFPAVMREEMLQPEFLASTGEWRPEDTITHVWQRSTAQSGLERMLDTDVNSYLPDDLLVKMDIATMAYSVEARSPFLDHHLMEFAAALPARLKLHRTNGKVLLKYALRGIVPDEILDRGKMGFGVPLPHWFRRELRNLPAEVLLGADARVRAYVRPEAIQRMINEHQAEQADHSARLWTLLQLELWHQEVVESPLLQHAPAAVPRAPAAQTAAAG